MFHNTVVWEKWVGWFSKVWMIQGHFCVTCVAGGVDVWSNHRCTNWNYHKNKKRGAKSSKDICSKKDSDLFRHTFDSTQICDNIFDPFVLVLMSSVMAILLYCNKRTLSFTVLFVREENQLLFLLLSLMYLL